MFSPLKSVLRSLHLPRIIPTIEEEERAYLEAATSRIDLERRERDVSAGRFTKRGFGW